MKELKELEQSALDQIREIADKIVNDDIKPFCIKYKISFFAGMGSFIFINNGTMNLLKYKTIDEWTTNPRKSKYVEYEDIKNVHIHNDNYKYDFNTDCETNPHYKKYYLQQLKYDLINVTKYNEYMRIYKLINAEIFNYNLYEFMGDVNTESKGVN